MSQSSLWLTVAATVWAVGALPTLAMGLAGWDPVGRLGRSPLGRSVNARWGWFALELPALVTFPAIYLLSDNQHLVGNVLVGLWLAHYGHRALVWSWLVPKRRATVSLGMCGASIGFNLVNGGLLGWLMGYAAKYAEQWLSDPRFVVGLVLFALGAGLNVWADYRLKYLRKVSGDDRVAPTGGAFRFVCCPNLAGEIIEWAGFALLTWSLPGLAFALLDSRQPCPSGLVAPRVVPRQLRRLPSETGGARSRTPIGPVTVTHERRPARATAPPWPECDGGWFRNSPR